MPGVKTGMSNVAGHCDFCSHIGTVSQACAVPAAKSQVHQRHMVLGLGLELGLGFAVAKRKPEEKNPGLYGIRTLNLCDTDAAL